MLDIKKCISVYGFENEQAECCFVRNNTYTSTFNNDIWWNFRKEKGRNAKNVWIDGNNCEYEDYQCFCPYFFEDNFNPCFNYTKELNEF